MIKVDLADLVDEEGHGLVAGDFIHCAELVVDVLDELEHLSELRLGHEMSISMLTPLNEEVQYTIHYKWSVD